MTQLLPLTPKEEADAATAQQTTHRVDRLIAQIAKLTTIDGAVVMNHALGVLAFGAKLPSQGKAPTVLSITPDRQLGDPWQLDQRGTRHRAAATFAKCHPKGLAFIVSQDGEAAIFQQLNGEIVHWPLSL
jgi:DNA integrity scanning protein DisA with diadenylate cyclase activity